jgi:hypothetical protein
MVMGKSDNVEERRTDRARQHAVGPGQKMEKFALFFE